VALGGEIKDVKNGFARNYLIPKKLALPATKDAMQRVVRLSRDAEEKRLKTLADMKALGKELDGARVDVEMRAGSSGRLYGSVTNAVVAAELSKMTDREIDRRTIDIPGSIRDIGLHSATIRLHPEVLATISLLVYARGTDPEATLLKLQADAEGDDEGEGEAIASTDTKATAPDAEPAPVADAEPVAVEEADSGDV
jgi:large subunit ribosomal protein L9